MVESDKLPFGLDAEKVLGHMRDLYADNDTSHIADTKSAGRFDPSFLGATNVKHHATGHKPKK